MTLPGIWEKKGCIITPENLSSWWKTHVMAPSAIEIQSKTIRIYAGGWDAYGISRIGYIDVDADNPTIIKHISENPVLDIGTPGTFDENGVFPGHASIINNTIYLYYTGFQLGHKVRHYNFGGLAQSTNRIDFTRVTQAPILDRSDEGLCVRAGQSVLKENDLFHTCYSAGSAWEDVGGKSRPTYNIFYQPSTNGIDYAKYGLRIIACHDSLEHGLGRPQIIKLFNQYIVCYTRRTRDMRYHMGCATSQDLIHWQRQDDWLAIPHGQHPTFDSDMVYFPSILKTSHNKIYLFYSGNDFGKGGLGVAELLW